MTTPQPRRSPRPQDRQRSPERTRNQILEAARVEFAAHGYAGARIAAIATRAGVNQQAISYYFDGKEGLYEALTQVWRQRESELVNPDMALSEQLQRYAMEALRNPDDVRLLAWGGLEYDGPQSDVDNESRSQRLRHTVDRIAELRETGRIPGDVDPACLTVMLMAAAMATTSLPQVIEGVCGADPRSPEFIRHYAEQVGVLARLLGLDATES